MKSISLIASVIFLLLCSNSKANGQSLSSKEESIVTISAFTANGDLSLLRNSLNKGLNAGLTVNEIKEILVQLYAYAGFPRSLNALQTFQSVLNERRQKGVQDPPGRLPNPLSTVKTKLQFGTEMQTKLVGATIQGGIYEFAPAIDQFLKEHLFGDIFGRDNLDWKTRELATISALASLGGTENQLRSHFGVGMYNGLTEAQLEGVVSVIRDKVGNKEGDSAQSVLTRVLGRSIPGSSRSKSVDLAPSTMTGKVSVIQMAPADSTFNTTVASVSFAPGARTFWHSHQAGQILIVMDGTGSYQEKGKPARFIRKGDVIKCPPNVIHWHGATPITGMTHMAITTNTATGRVIWMQEVTEQEFTTVVGL